MNLKGATLWFTGLPSSGKSTLAREVYQRLHDSGCAVELLDGSGVRESLSRDLGFSREDREENVRRIGFVAKLLSRNGVIAICAAVSPYRSTRDEVRGNTTNFVEVYVECPVEVAEARDADGMYARARRGELPDFTGVTGPYESPLAPEVHVNTATESLDQGAWKVIRTLEILGIINPEGRVEADTGEESLRKRLAGLGYL